MPVSHPHHGGLAPRTRRSASAALLTFPWIWTGLRAQPVLSRVPTPSQTEGPFYPLVLPRDADFDLLNNGPLAYAHGQPAWLEGTVVDLNGKPVNGAQVEIWQCDHAGHYDHPGDGGRIDRAFQGFGKVTADAAGEYRFRTIRPVAYSGRTPHIHVKIRLGRRELLTTQLYVAEEPLNQRDFLWRNLPAESRVALTVPFTGSSDGLRATFPIVVRT